MTRNDAVFLRHMLDAIDRVVEATSRTTLEQFQRDWIVQDAIIRELQVLGEAAGRVAKELADRNPEIPWKEITGLRHKLVHDYFVVDLEVVWATATVDVPTVRSSVQTLLDGLST
jgi:uncharacterized protein with HEPN domain